MARKPKVQAVVSEAVFEQFQQWKLDNGFETDGDAIRAILSRVISGDIGEISADNEIDSRVGKIEKMLGESLDRIKQLEEEVSQLKAPNPSEFSNTKDASDLPVSELKQLPQETKEESESDISDISEASPDKTPSDGTGGESYPPNSNEDATDNEPPHNSEELPEDDPSIETSPAPLKNEATNPDDPSIEIKLLIADQAKYWEEVAESSYADQSRAITRFLISNGFKDDEYYIQSSYMTKWRKGQATFPSNPKSKHYLASIVYQEGIMGNLK